MRAILCQSLAEASSLFWGKSEIEKPVLPPSAKFILSGVKGFRINSVEGCNRSTGLMTKSKIASLLRQKGLRLSDLRPISVGFCADRHKLGEVSFGFLPVAGRLGGSSHSVKPPVAVGVLI